MFISRPGRFKAISTIFAIIAFMAPPALGSQPDSLHWDSVVVQFHRDLDQLYQDLQTTAREFVEADSVVVQRPVILFDSVSDSLRLSLGRVLRARVIIDPSDPIRYPLEAQIWIESVRKALRNAPVDTPSADDHLTRADTVVYAMLGNILAFEMLGDQLRQQVARASSEQEVEALLTAHLTELNHEVDLQIGEVEQALTDAARAQGWEVAVLPDAAANERFSVSISSAPPGGRIEVISDLEYRRGTVLRRLSPDELRWETLGPNARLVGWYHYRVTWSDGTRQEGRIHITDHGTRTLP